MQTDQSQDNIWTFTTKMSTTSPTTTMQSKNNENVNVECQNYDHHRTEMQTPRVVHFAESSERQESEEIDDNSFYRMKNPNQQTISKKIENESNQSQSTGYSSMYLSPQESPFQLLSRSSPNSPIGSNVSIVGSLISHGSNERKSNSGGNGGGSTNWKLRAKYYSKRRGQERSIDRERQPSICSDSETDSINGQQKIGNPNS